jgi:hypothetical protein
MVQVITAKYGLRRAKVVSVKIEPLYKKLEHRVKGDLFSSIQLLQLTNSLI